MTPFSKNIARSILKAPKIYFFDNGLVQGDEGVRFENLMALCLLKHVYRLVDTKGQPYALHYLRTKERAEVDFCIVHDDHPKLMIEAKRAEPDPVKTMIRFRERYGIPAVQVVLHLKREKQIKGVEVRKAQPFLESLAG